MTVTYNESKLIEGTDYTVSYSNNINAGTATVIITGKGSYSGEKILTFTILPVGWVKTGSTWYWMDKDGKITKNKWIQTGGKWYYMTSSGAMATGWQQIGGKWYYMNSSGAMTTGWQQIGGKWYYMKADGTMVTGRQTIGGKAYKFNSSGVWIQ